MSCGLSEKHAKPRMQITCVSICLIYLSVPTLRVVAMTFLFLNLNFINIICSGHDADP